MIDAGRTVNPKTYNAFVQQIELQALWLVDSRISNRHGPWTPEQANVNVGASAEYEATPGGFLAFHKYTVRVESSQQLKTETFCEVEVTFGVYYDSQQDMTDAIFAVFQEVNLALNTWPYLRSFVADAFGRMNWEPYTLSAIKVGSASVVSNVSEGMPKKTRARRKSLPETAH